MYIIFRCNCGRALYTRKGVAEKKCICGKVLKIKSRRILYEVEDAQAASRYIRKFQEEKYGNGYFTTADKIK